MKRLGALILLLLYGAFSGITLASDHFLTEKSEPTEKEVVTAIYTEHTQSGSFQLLRKRGFADHSNHHHHAHSVLPDCVDSPSQQPSEIPKLPVALYILHCVYRL